MRYTTICKLSLLAISLPLPTQAYQIFWDRETWEEEIENKPLVVEEFNIPNQFLVPRPFVLPTGLTAEDIDAIGGSAVIEEQLFTGIGFPTSLEEFAFPNPVTAFGFEFRTPPEVPGVDGFKTFTLMGDFGEIPLRGEGFWGITATSDTPPLDAFQTFGDGEIGALNIDDLGFTPIPEPSSIITSIILIKGIVLKKIKHYQKVYSDAKPISSRFQKAPPKAEY